MRLLGIDCATKSLAVSIVEFNSNWSTDLKEISEHYSKLWKTQPTLQTLKNRVDEVNSLFDNLFTLHYVTVFDLLPGESIKGVSIEKRMGRLKGAIEYIKKVNKSIKPFREIDKVLIEYQMSANDKSRNVSVALTYAFINEDYGFSCKTPTDLETPNHSRESSSKVEMVGPSLKSKVYFGSAGMMQNFRKKYMNNYTANKAHSKYNFNEWITNHGCQEKIAQIPKKNLDDVADSFLMVYGWCIKNFVS